jgi:putative DNA primase/helicase
MTDENESGMDRLVELRKYRRKRKTGSAGLEDDVALEFAVQHTNNYRYIADSGRWMRWTGTRWQPEKTLAAFDAARALCRAAQKADAKVVAGVERLARSDRRLAATLEQWDADPEIFAADGMTVELRTGDDRAPRPEDYCSKIAGTNVAPSGARCRLWLRFLLRVTNKDKKLIRFLQRWLGYCLTGNVNEQVLVFLYGTGANGKGVFTSTIAGIFNDYCVTAPMEMFIESRIERHPTEIARLMGARLVIAQETQQGRRWDEAKIKNLTGADRLTARFMRGDFFDFKPTHKLMIAGNHKPSLRNVDEAIRRRFLLVPFTVTIPEDERDPELAEKLKAEWPAILRWMVDGCLAWRKKGLDVPQVIRDASAEYFSDEDTIVQWADEWLEKAGSFGFATSRDLFKSWRLWCEERNFAPGTEKAFVENLKDHGYQYERKNYGRGFKGIALKANNASSEAGDGW